MADRYWVGNGGNWNDTAHWSASSGGASGASVPTSSDNVFFNGSSGTGTCTINVTANCLNFDTTGSTIGTIAGSFTTLNVYGNMVLKSGLSFSKTGTINFLATSGTKTITSNGVNIYSAIVLNGSGGTFQLADDLYIRENFTRTAGTFDPNSKTVYLNGLSTYQALRNLTFYNLTANCSGSSNRLGIYYGSQGVTVTNILSINGISATNRLLVQSDYIENIATLTVNGSISASYVDFQNIAAAGSASWNLSAITGGSGDWGNNTGITFTTGIDLYWHVDAGNWNDASKWFTATNGGGSAGRVPLPQDNCHFDANSFDTGSQTITINTKILGHDIDFTGVDNAPNLAFSTNTYVFGDFIFGTGMTTSGTNSFQFVGDEDVYLTTNGVTISTYLYPRQWKNIGQYKLTLLDDLTCLQTITVYGDFDANDFDVTAGRLDMSAGVMSSVYLGNGTWTLNGTYDPLSLNANFYAEGSTVKVTDTSASAKRLFLGSNIEFNNLEISGDNITIYYGLVANTLTINNPGAANGIFMRPGIEVVVNNLVAVGTAGNLIKIQSSTAGSPWYISSPTGGLFECDYLYLKDSYASLGGEVSYNVAATTFGMTTLTGGATSVVLTDDSLSADISIPWTFDFFGSSKTTFKICSNGYIRFAGSTTSGYDVPLPDSGVNDCIIPLSADLDPEAGGTIKYETFGTTPNRIMVIEWYDVPYWGETEAVRVQAKLFESDGHIEFHVETADSTTSSYNYESGQGIQSSTGVAIYLTGRNIFYTALTNDGVTFTRTTSPASIWLAGINSTDATGNTNWVFGSTSSSERGATLHGEATANSERNAKITGKETDTSERGATLHGQILDDDERGGRTWGIDTNFSERTGKITGKQTDASERAAKLHGQVLDNSERGGRLWGIDTILSERLAVITGKLTSFAERAARLIGQALINSEQGAHLTGKATATAERAAIVTGKQLDNSERSGHLVGKATATSERGGHLIGKATAFVERLAKLIGKLTSNSERGGHLTGKDTDNATRGAKIHGTLDDASERSVITHGQILTDSERNAHLHGKATATSERMGKIHGTLDIAAEILAHLYGGLLENDQRDAHLHGKNTAYGERRVRLIGKAVIGRPTPLGPGTPPTVLTAMGGVTELGSVQPPTVISSKQKATILSNEPPTTL